MDEAAESPPETPTPPRDGKPPVERKPKPKRKRWEITEFNVDPKEGETRFHDLGLPDSLMHGICELGFQYCTPIQAGIVPGALEGKDCTGRAQTGTGKSAAFLITIISKIIKNPIKGGPKKGFPRALILAPTRELALQIEKDALGLTKFTRLRVLSVFGGMGYEKQRRTLTEKSVDIVVATPGRLLDFKRQKVVDLSRVEMLVLDEADRMLDMGFIPDIRQIIHSTPNKDKRQTMFFSATLTPEIARLASQWTREPFNVEIEPDQVASDTVDQKVYIVTSDEKFALLYNLITQQNLERVIIFSNRRDQTRNLADKLNRHDINCALLSGEVTQSKRLSALEGFREGKIRALVATDVAARGIHVDGVTHVINYNLPDDPDHYVHRIGRTGRAGTTGISVSFACEDDSFQIPAIEEFLGNELKCDYPEDEWLVDPPPPKPRPKQSKDGQSRGRSGSRGGNSGRRGSSQGRPGGRRPSQKTRSRSGSQGQRSRGGSQGGQRSRSGSQGQRSRSGSQGQRSRGGSRGQGSQNSSAE